ncbi:MAG: hypothetical protein J6C03_01315 [Clostridia bacterium]|nr:hypothetical protein [Clostridia bacterium]
MRNRILNNIIITLNIIMLLIVVFAPITVKSGATSIKSPFTLDFYQDTLNAQTSFRIKETNSDVYMKCEKSDEGYIAVVGGGNYFYDYVDCSEGYQYYFVEGRSRYMHSNVYGNYLFAKIYSCNFTSELTASGVWSPDSVYEEGVLPSTDDLASKYK